MCEYFAMRMSGIKWIEKGRLGKEKIKMREKIFVLRIYSFHIFTSIVWDYFFINYTPWYMYDSFLMNHDVISFFWLLFLLLTIVCSHQKKRRPKIFSEKEMKSLFYGHCLRSLLILWGYFWYFDATFHTPTTFKRKPIFESRRLIWLHSFPFHLTR